MAVRQGEPGQGVDELRIGLAFAVVPQFPLARSGVPVYFAQQQVKHVFEIGEELNLFTP